MTNFKTMLLAATALTMISGATLAQSNEATSSQTGDDNETTITQQSAGRGHQATVTSTGDENEVEVDQVSTGSNAGGATVTIDGGDNEVEVSQSKFHSQGPRLEQSATIVIDGDQNDVFTDQEYGSDGSSTNTLTIALNGNGNGSVQSSGNFVDVFQTNNGNTATVDAWGDDNELFITQRGGDFASISVDGSGDSGDEGSDNSVEIDQTFSDPSYQNGGNTARVEVNGNRNNAVGGSFGTLGLQAGLVTQVGGGNVVDLTLGTLNGINSDDNTFGIDQRGLRNSITGTILGEFNTAGMLQSGDDNTVEFSQIGNGNELSSSQTGNSNGLTSTQSGDFNVLTSTQTGNGNVTVSTQIGSFNTSTITQGYATQLK